MERLRNGTALYNHPFRPPFGATCAEPLHRLVLLQPHVLLPFGRPRRADPTRTAATLNAEIAEHAEALRARARPSPPAASFTAEPAEAIAAYRGTDLLLWSFPGAARLRCPAGGAAAAGSGVCRPRSRGRPAAVRREMGGCCVFRRMSEVIGNPTFGDAILDRLVHHAHRLTLKGASMRRKDPPTSTSVAPAAD